MQLLDGYNWRQETHENLAAYFVCQLLNVSGKVLKHSITPKRLLEPLRQPVKYHDKKADEEYLKQRFGLE